ncbi:MAG: hypothetical protein ABSA15_05705, partial [Thermoplasmata archaeon]
RSGSFAVAGSSMTGPTIAFTAYTLPVTFSETGLPSGAAWYVNVTNSVGVVTSLRETGTDAVLNLQNGSYTYTVAANGQLYHPSPGTGSFGVAGSPVTIPSITFTKYTYTVTFSETGLSSGTSWYVNITGQTGLVTTSGSVTINLVNGTYGYYVANANKRYATTSTNGTFAVAGASNTIGYTYSPFSYLVTFSEMGLPSGTPWYVNITGQTGLVTTSGTATLGLVNGTYVYGVANANKRYATTSTNGTFAVAGAPKTVSYTYSTFNYRVTFSETGLPSGTSWSVTLNGTLHSGTTSTIGFTIPNGSYAYAVGTVRNYSTAVSGSANVAGANVGISVTYTLVTYTITFQATGLSSGTLWNVTVGALTVSSTTPTISLQEQNGTYTYTTQSAGSNTTTGIVVVNGASPTTVVAVQFSSTSSSSGISTMTWIIIVAVIVIIAIIIIVIVVALMMRGRGGAQKPAPPT